MLCGKLPTRVNKRQRLGYDYEYTFFNIFYFQYVFNINVQVPNSIENETMKRKLRMREKTTQVLSQRRKLFVKTMERWFGLTTIYIAISQCSKAGEVGPPDQICFG